MKKLSNEQLLLDLQGKTFSYFSRYANDRNGLIADKSAQGAPASITSVGLALTAYPTAVERGYLSRAEARRKTLTALRFFAASHQGPEAEATGYKGFYYHFLDMESGQRMPYAELSTIDSTFLVAGMLAAAAYFDQPTADEREIRELADALYRRMDWQWALHSGRRVAMAWMPDVGFQKPVWEGYSEALLLYILGLGSPTYPLPPETYIAWQDTYHWEKVHGYEYLHAGPLFIHQLSHVWLDFRGIYDTYMRDKGIDYAENSRRATYAQQAYARQNPRGYKGYGEWAWGITASDGPGELIRHVDGKERRFYGYLARGIPHGPDDGTLSPWAAIASLPFAPELVIPSIRYLEEHYPEITSELGFRCSFNPTFPDGEKGWISEGYYGLDQGPIVIMIENYLTGLIWQMMRRCPYIVRGLRQAGFAGGWLDEAG